MSEQGTIDENKRRAVNALRELADKIERGAAALYTVKAGVEPEYDLIQHHPIGTRADTRSVSRYVRTLSIIYSERASPMVTCKLEDFTGG